MDIVALTRRLVDVESTTGSEGRVGEFLLAELGKLGYTVKKMPVEPDRFNVFATAPGKPKPALVFSTHMDTVPPYFPSREDKDRIYGRGACDAKGILAAQVAAAERLRAEGIAVGLLFLVGEERDSLGAAVANRRSPGSRFLINGEPTENKLALASKGALRVLVTARGKSAHSAYPELGDSAIDKLLEALARLRALPLPSDPEIGPCTLNIGVLEGGQAPNVVADHAQAHLLFRLIGPSTPLRWEIEATVKGLATAQFTLEIPFIRLRTLDGLPTMVAAFTSDVPSLDKWGEPLMLGPGSIHVAHTDDEYVEKKQLHEAVELYCMVAKKLLA
ncbi:MAG TPA: M20/M25/M40 family metallo-hydrolase [Terriglobales bacterium]|jgi:acetylornithine deacetylase|nr:M20/M25/M40 family metallo-hydrolase [Terriglobales bacterium]